MKATIEEDGVGQRLSKRQIATRNSAFAEELKIDTVLVPIDFSRASLQAIPWAKFFARATDGTIHLVHVHGFEYPLPLGIIPPVVTSPAEIEKRLRRYLKKFATSYGLTAADVYCHVKTGSAFDQICKVAREIDADLIVTSTHGHTGWKRLFLGSTAERIVRHTPCPVWVARKPRTGRVRTLSVSKIVVPLDFSRASIKGLNYAVKLARGFAATLTLLHVVSRQRFLTPKGALVYAEAELTQRARVAAKERMRALVGITDFDGVEFKTAIRVGFPEEEICNYAQKNSMDLIVTATHGRTGLRHALLGSVAEHVVRYAKGPLLVVPTRSIAGASLKL